MKGRNLLWAIISGVGMLSVTASTAMAAADLFIDQRFTSYSQINRSSCVRASNGGQICDLNSGRHVWASPTCALSASAPSGSTWWRALPRGCSVHTLGLRPNLDGSTATTNVEDISVYNERNPRTPIAVPPAAAVAEAPPAVESPSSSDTQSQGQTTTGSTGPQTLSDGERLVNELTTAPRPSQTDGQLSTAEEAALGQTAQPLERGSASSTPLLDRAVADGRYGSALDSPGRAATTGGAAGTTAVNGGGNPTGGAGSNESEPRNIRDLQQTNEDVRARGSDDECATSSGLGLNSCKTTRRIVQGMQGTAQGVDQVGAMGVQIRSSSAVADADREFAENGGVAVAAQNRAMAATLEAQSTMQFVSAGINLGAAVTVGTFARKHGNDLDRIQDELSAARTSKSLGNVVTAQTNADGSASTTSSVVDSSNASGNELLSAVLEDKDGNYNEGESQVRRRLAGEVRQVRGQAEAEVSGVKSEAMVAMSQHAMQSMLQAAQAGMARKQASELRRSARQLEEDANRLPNAAFQLGGEEFLADATTGDAAPSITGDGDTSAQVADEDSATDEPEGLGDPAPLDLGGDEMAQAPPPAGVFNEKAGGAGGGAGGSPGGAASASATPAAAAASAADDQPKAFNARGRAGMTYAATGGNSGRYSAAGAGRSAATGGMGPDLTKMMEQFLGKKAGEEPGRGGGILDFGSNAAQGGGQPLSMLDRNVNIFDRIHETYQDKAKRGLIGL